jgi:hypothetical protein
MKKETLNLFTFILAIACTLIYIFTLNVLALGFSLLFGIMFVVDSFWYFLKKFFIQDKLQAIGGDVK